MSDKDRRKSSKSSYMRAARKQRQTENHYFGSNSNNSLDPAPATHAEGSADKRSRGKYGKGSANTK